MLAVFANGFTLEAAESVVDGAQLPINTLDGVASLVDNSLVRELDEPDSGQRFLMLSTIREYGLEQLSASHLESDARQRHADWCLALTERAEPELTHADALQWLNRLEQEHDNIRAGLNWLLEQGDVDACQRLSSAIWLFWFFRCYFHEARSWLDRILELAADTRSSMHASLLVVSGVFTESVGDFAEATERLEAGRRMAIDLDDKVCLGMAMLGLGDVADNTGQHERAGEYLSSAVELFRETGLDYWLVLTLAFLGSLAQRRGDEAEASALMHEALSLSRQIGFLWGTAISLNRLGRLARHRADYMQAAERFRESLAIWRELGDHWRMSRALIDLADVASANHHFEHAARLLGAAQAINESIGASESFVDDTARLRAIAVVTERLDASSLTEAWEAGRAMSWDDAIAEAMTSTLPVRETPKQPGDRIPEFGLTTRELEVLRLLVAGHTDRQIAEDLFISRRTAQGHVASIFNKLGVNSRTAAATAALRDGLIDAEAPLS